MGQITIKDIASELGISYSTVSRALSNHPDVHEKTRKEVVEKAEKMGYRPNIFARNLKSSHSNQIGVIVPEIRHDFFANAVAGIEDVAYQKGYTVIVSQSNEDVAREEINVRSMFINRVAGILVSVSQTTSSSDHFNMLLENGVKMVFFDRIIEEMDVFKVVINDEESSYNAVKYLIEKGYKKIVHLAGPQNLGVCRNRKLGYEHAMSDFNLGSEIKVVEGGMHENDGSESVEQLISSAYMPEAIFAVNDPVAIGAFKRLREMNISIPDQVGIVGFSNNPIAEIVEPKLTTVEQPAYEMGRKAAELLIDQIEDNQIDLVNKTLTLDSHLIVRQST